jgi:hypothetical protein
MKIRKFKIYQTTEERMSSGGSSTLLINLDHLVSLRPINVAHNGHVTRAYWIRLANGKKYKAVEIPAELEEMLALTDLPSIPFESESELNDLH